MTTRQDTDTKTATSHDALVDSGLGLVYAIAAKVYKSIDRAVEFDELVSLGTIGLMQAAERYDRSSKARFTTYAYYRVHGAIIDGLRTMGPMSRAEWRRYKEETALDETTTTTASVTSVKVAEPVVSQPTAIADIATKEAERVITDAMTRLPERESYLIDKCYFNDSAMGDAGRDMGLSKSWTSRLHTRALQSLRRELSDYSYASLAA